MNPDWRSRYERAIDITRTAGQHALKYFDTKLTVETKGDSSPVTIADRETEQALRTALGEAFPADGFLGEEFGDTPGTSGFRWIVDPIDGTRSFVRGVPLWATMVGLAYQGECIGGIVFLPALKQVYRALKGDGAFRGDRRIRVSDVKSLDKAHVYYSSISWFKRAGHERQFLELVDVTERQRGFGDFYGFVMIAQGSGEIMVEHGVHAWD